VSQRLVHLVIGELALVPYAAFAVLKYPQNFYDRSLVTLQSALSRVRFETIQDFVRARSENLKHFESFIETFSRFLVERVDSKIEQQYVETLQAL
jgi:hypothetical protein